MNEQAEGKNEFHDAPGVVVFPPLLLLGAMASGVALQFVRSVHLWRALPARIAGGAFILTGIATIIAAKKRMKRAGTNVNPMQPTTSIVSDGPYRFSRNPIYIGGTAAYVGLALLFNAFWPLLTLIPFLAVMHWGVVLREERYLEAKFGEAYLGYKARVRRWL